MRQRSIAPFLAEFLNDKMVLLSGPRQVGKTYLSKKLERKIQYFNYDSLESRMEMLEKSWLRDGSLVVFDEIHKMHRWKQWLKGPYDIERGLNKILITGSARLDTYKKIGDSLAGRHFSVRLLPFSLKEFDSRKPRETFDSMLDLGSFPEPLLSGSKRRAALWRKSHLDIILCQDILGQETIRNIQSIERLVEILSTRVGQGISYKNLGDELSVSSRTIERWLQLLVLWQISFSLFMRWSSPGREKKK